MRATLFSGLLCAALSSEAKMPAVFENGLVFLDMPAPDGSKIHMYTDSGGGSVFTLSNEAADRLTLPKRPTTNEEFLRWLGPNVRLTHASAYMEQHWQPLQHAARFAINPGAPAFQGYPATTDGSLGESWFGGHSWTWDYPHQQLLLRPKHWQPASAARDWAVTFQTPAKGARQLHYPRVMISVDGAAIPMLFDSGALTVLTPAALLALDDGMSATRSTSMITHSVFEAWHARHPDWRVIDDAQLKTHSRMILAANVDAAGVSLGPVWFTERPDENFHGMMSSLMSGQVEGSIGPNAFSDVIVSVDYPRSRAWLQTKDWRH
jgi:hypothetical protein